MRKLRRFVSERCFFKVYESEKARQEMTCYRLPRAVVFAIPRL